MTDVVNNIIAKMYDKLDNAQLTLLKQTLEYELLVKEKKKN